MANFNYDGVWYRGRPFVSVDDMLRVATELKLATAVQILSAIRKDMSGKERVEVFDAESEQGPVEVPEQKPEKKSRIKENGYF